MDIVNKAEEKCTILQIELRNKDQELKNILQDNKNQIREIEETY